MVARVADGESPVDAAVIGVSLGFPCGQFPREFGSASDTTVQALTRQDAEFDFGNVEPTSVARGVDDMEPPRQAVRFGGRKGLVQRGDAMSIQIVANQRDLAPWG